MLPILLAVLAQALPPPAADDGPTAFACTVDKLLRRERCTFEGLAPPAATPAQTGDAIDVPDKFLYLFSGKVE